MNYRHQLPTYREKRSAIIRDAKFEEKLMMTRTGIYLDRITRCYIWNSCKFQGLREYGLAGEICRIIELYLTEKRIDFIQTTPYREAYIYYRRRVDEQLPLNVAAAMVLAVRLFKYTIIVTAEVVEKQLNAQGFYQYTHLDISDRMCDMILTVHTRGYRFPMYSTLQMAKFLALYADIQVGWFDLLPLAAETAEFVRYRIAGDLREAENFNIRDNYRVLGMDLAAASAYATAKFCKLDRSHALPILAKLTSTSTTYISSLADLIIFYLETETMD